MIKGQIYRVQKESFDVTCLCFDKRYLSNGSINDLKNIVINAEPSKKFLENQGNWNGFKLGAKFSIIYKEYKVTHLSKEEYPELYL